MCGIVGLLIKRPALRPALGELMLPMLIGMTERGPDSTGLAVYREPVAAGLCKFSLYARGKAVDWDAIARDARERFGRETGVDAKANHAILTTQSDFDTVEAWLAGAHPEIALLSSGHAMDIYKDVGSPAAVAD